MNSVRNTNSFDDKMHTSERSDSTDRERLLVDEEDAHWSGKKSVRSGPGRWLNIIFVVVIAVVSCLVGIFIGHNQGDSDKACTRRITQHSPVVSHVGLNYHKQQFNGSLLKENIFRQDASPEVDAAWESLGANYRSIRVPAEEAEKSGLAPDQVKINEKYGGGYPANVEGFHHLHCLNLLRQSLYYNYDYYHDLGKGAFTNNDYVVRRHVTHCLDIIRQQLMCTVDVGVLGQVWVHPDHPEPFVDFNTEHKCRNFEEIRDWAQRNQLPETVPNDFLQPPKIGDRVFNRGYERFRAQKLEKRTTGDLKEGFFLGRHLPLDDPDGQTRSSSETRVDRYYGAVLSLTIDLMTVIAEIVGLDSDALRRFCTKPIATLHLLHYPPQAPDASELERGIGAHSDFGAITILLQDSVGGSTGLGPDIE
ncbi:naringenin,2-oxoglutarate 3-dioxygenase [Aspergillus awamori]|uniref:Naringenin,2-oxoglutarate 3-dioxygenase n=2 Tax=Aspergillus TaxID=5052 RepID=A0A401KQ55_ASPAW|nr:naringenin,2-oxoglutarate 3-dioxygenase [Aspergillus awamori]